MSEKETLFHYIWRPFFETGDSGWHNKFRKSYFQVWKWSLYGAFLPVSGLSFWLKYESVQSIQELSYQQHWHLAQVIIQTV